jgi:hypothetical protein
MKKGGLQMPVNHEVKDIAKKVFDGGLLSANEISTLLKIEPHSVDAGFVMGSADEINRDTEVETSKGRGIDVETCRKIFKEADFDILKGPSVIYSENNILWPR